MNFDKWYDEIRELVEKSENPLFFFDDDSDGLASFLLLWRHIQRGKGIIVKRYPDLDLSFVRKVEEYHPDRIFVLDKYDVNQEFIDRVNRPVVWIDHHEVKDRKGVKYYNPRMKDKDIYLPVSYLCYKTVKNDLWLAMCGIVGDYYLDKELIKEVNKQYPGFLGKVKNAGDALYKTDLGKLTKIMNFSIKGDMNDVKKSIAVWMKIQSPYEVLNSETARGKFLMKRHEKINKAYMKLYDKAVSSAKGKLLIFNYPSSKMSFTGDLATELSYRYPNKVIIISRDKENHMILSLRDRKHDLPKLLEKALDGLDGYGGGHKEACGANVSKDDYPKFIENLKKLI